VGITSAKSVLTRRSATYHQRSLHPTAVL